MKQVVQDVRSGKTRLLDVPQPQPQPGTALVRTRASLVSAGTERSVIAFAERSLAGKARSRPDLVRQVLEKARREGLLSTLEAVQNRLDQPLALGYASAGVIAAIGAGLAGFQAGDRVACAGGGHAVHAEYAVVPQNLLARLPEEVDFEAGAFATLGAIAMHGFRLGEGALGERVAVVGLGLLGLLAASIARAAGCQVMGFDVRPDRVNFARSLGFEAAAREGGEAQAQAFTHGDGFDLVQICADTESNDTVEFAGEIARDRGRVVATGNVGTALPRRLYYDKELRFVVSRSYGPGRYDPRYEEKGIDYPISYVRWTEGRNLDAFLALLADGSIDVARFITHRFPIEEALKAYDLISDPGGDYVGVVLTYGDETDSGAASERIPLIAQDISPASTVTLGLVGAGNFAANVMLPAIKGLSGVERVGVVTASGLRAATLGRKFGFRYAAPSFETLLADDAINTIAVLTRHHLHAQQVQQALSRGKHVFCEKPLALTDAELNDVEQALKRSSSLLMVGFNRRFAPLARRMKAFFQEHAGPLAIHYRVNAGPLPDDHWLLDPEQGGGRMIGEACHFLDFIIYLIGALPVRVSAQAIASPRSRRDESAFIALTFADGSLGTLAYLVEGDRAFPKERVEAFGAGRVAALDDFRSLELTSGGRKRKFRAWLRQDKGHRGEWQAFVEAIRRGGPPPIPYAQLLAATRASFAAQQALRTGAAVDLAPSNL